MEPERLGRYMPGEGIGLQIGAIALLVALTVLVVAKYQVEDLKDELLSERNRRRLAERSARERGEQLDGALEKIHELRPDEPAAG